MNAGFSNLDTLKQHLLAPALRATNTYDVQITDLGRGIADLMEQFCNRKFYRVAGETEIIKADRCQFSLSRFPLEAITAIDQKSTEAGGWVAQVINDFVTTIDLKEGIVNCPDGADAGEWFEQVRFTYTGGYFWNTLEPDEANYPEVLPAGANALPNSLKLSWLLQCKHVWQTIDPRGTKIVGGDKEARQVPQQVFGDLELIPQVKASLGQFIRFPMV